MSWPVETILDNDKLYMGIHKSWFYKDGEIMPGAFRDHEEGMSTEWSKYSTPDQTRQNRRIPSDNAIMAMQVGEVRDIPNQEVQHTPTTRIRAHTDVSGEKTPEARLKFKRVAQMVISLD